jgi:hypothetical protein
MRTFALRRWAGLLRDPRRDEAVFAHHDVAGAVLNRALDLGQLVAPSYEEQMWIVAHLLVRRDRHPEPFKTGVVRSLAYERSSSIAGAFVQFLDALVHLAKVISWITICIGSFWLRPSLIEDALPSDRSAVIPYINCAIRRYRPGAISPISANGGQSQLCRGLDGRSPTPPQHREARRE